MYRIGEESKKKVYEAFERTEAIVDEDVEVITKWMKSQPHLPELMDAVKIRNFLHLNKFSIEKTKQKIDMYYSIRGLLPDMFAHSNPKCESLQKTLKDVNFCTHPFALNGTHRIYILKAKRPDVCCPLAMSMIFFATFEVRLYEDFMTDDIFILDFNNFTLNDMKKYTLSLVSKSATIYQKVYSLRLRNLHLLNSPPYVSMLMAVLKAVLKPKIFDRVEVHRDAKIMNEIFPNDQLPKDYGGDGPSLLELAEMTKGKFREYQHRFDLLDNLKVDETLRPQKLDNDDVLGFYGNFKKLDVD